MALNGSAKLGEFPALHNLSLSFPNIKATEGDALRYFKRISELSMPINDLLQTQLLGSGTQRVDKMDLTWMALNVESVCEIALAFNVTDMSLCLSIIEESTWERCQSLESQTLTSDEHLSYVNLSFTHTLSNLKELSVYLYNYKASVDEILSSLCSAQSSPAELRAIFFQNRGNLIFRRRQFACLQNLEDLFLYALKLKTEDFAFAKIAIIDDCISWR